MHLAVEIVSPLGQLWSGPARSLVVPGVHGYLGILPRHTPLACVLTTGIVHVAPADDDPVRFTITGGFLFVGHRNHVLVLANEATRGDAGDESAC